MSNIKIRARIHGIRGVLVTSEHIIDVAADEKICALPAGFDIDRAYAIDAHGGYCAADSPHTTQLLIYLVPRTVAAVNNAGDNMRNDAVADTGNDTNKKPALQKHALLVNLRTRASTQSRNTRTLLPITHSSDSQYDFVYERLQHTTRVTRLKYALAGYTDRVLYISPHERPTHVRAAYDKPYTVHTKFTTCTECDECATTICPNKHCALDYYTEPRTHDFATYKLTDGEMFTIFAIGGLISALLFVILLYWRR